MCARGTRLCGDKCIDLERPCVTCSIGEKACAVYTSDGAKDNVCIPQDGTCPVSCGKQEHVCKGADGEEKCQPLDIPCEVHKMNSYFCF